MTTEVKLTEADIIVAIQDWLVKNGKKANAAVQLYITYNGTDCSKPLTGGAFCAKAQVEAK